MFNILPKSEYPKSSSELIFMVYQNPQFSLINKNKSRVKIEELLELV